MARWKLCASTTFEILPFSTCTLCQQKSYISKSIQPILKIFALSSKMLNVGNLGDMFQVRRYFTFAIARWKLCASTTFYIFPLSTMYTGPAKIQYLQRYSTDFRNLCIISKMLTVGIWVERFRCAGSFTFAMARWKLCASTTFGILPLSTCTLSQAKILYLQRYSTDFRNLCISSKMLTVRPFGLKVSGYTGILLLQWQSEDVAHRQHLKFCHFQHVHCCPQKSYISKGMSTDFRNLGISSKMLRVGIRLWRFQERRYFNFAMARWKLCASRTFEILPFSTCTLCQQKSYISQGI